MSRCIVSLITCTGSAYSACLHHRHFRAACSFQIAVVRAPTTVPPLVEFRDDYSVLLGVKSEARSASKSDPNPSTANALDRQINRASDQGHGWEPTGGQMQAGSQPNRSRHHAVPRSVEFRSPTALAWGCVGIVGIQIRVALFAAGRQGAMTSTPSCQEQHLRLVRLKVLAAGSVSARLRDS
jgi:hypothetical protein